MIPDVVWENVYRTDEAHMIAEDCDLIKLTFFNDQMISLKARISPRTPDNETCIEILCDDFEEWCATAIMTCDAGEDIWERPKPEQSQASQNLTATQVRAMQQQSQQQFQQALAGGSFGSAGQVQAGFGQGLAQGLAAGGLLPLIGGK